MPNLINIIRQLSVPKVILRYIMMNFLDLSSIHNLLLTVKEMNVLDNYSKDLIIKANKGFIWNCQNGHLTVAQWLYALGGVDIHAENEHAFRWSCRDGHLTVAQWLYSIGEGMDARKGQCNVNVNIHISNEYAFEWSCRNGHLTVAKWLYSLDGIDIHANDEYAFKWSCISGHLNVVQWLYSLGNVNIHADNEYAFRLSCRNGHLAVAKWLYVLGEGVSLASTKQQHRVNAKKKYAFRWSCINGHLPVVQWLYSIKCVNINSIKIYASKCSSEKVLRWVDSLTASRKKLIN